MTSLILDASVVISWCEELRDPIIFEELQELGYELVVPENVDGEIETGGEIYDDLFRRCSSMACDSGKFEDLSNRYFRLGRGELSVIALGQQYSDEDRKYLCVLDDKIARQACDDLELCYVGNIGICRILVENSSISYSEATTILEEMRSEGSRIPANHAELLADELSTEKT